MDGTYYLDWRWISAAAHGGTTMHTDHRNQEASGDLPETLLMFSALAALAIIAFWVLNS
jgi:dihydroorotase-like cyclic amidohydrolase